MNIFKSCKDTLLDFKNSAFEDLAFDIYKFQAKENPVFNEYHRYIGIDPENVSDLSDIPYLPIEFFKSKEIKSGNWQEEVIFTSSGTTGSQRSKHYLNDLDFYKSISLRNFEYFFGDVKSFHILALLPSYLERNDSSLIFMVDHFIKKSNKELSGFYLNDIERLVDDIKRVKESGEKLILWGVSFALLDLAEKHCIDLSDQIIIETGGMKGRREELTRNELHKILGNAFNQDKISSEYGMTELLSQCYSHENGIFETPPWMRVSIREINDPFFELGAKQTGGLNMIDLSNFHSCSFIETKDIGRITEAGKFEVMGRYDNSDIRGCNLLIN